MQRKYFREQFIDLILLPLHLPKETISSAISRYVFPQCIIYLKIHGIIILKYLKFKSVTVLYN